MAMTNIAIFRSTCSRAIVDRIRQTWPTVRIIVRGDAGFCREELLSWCERQTVPVDSVVGMGRAIRAITAEPARGFADRVSAEAMVPIRYGCMSPARGLPSRRSDFLSR